MSRKNIIEMQIQLYKTQKIRTIDMFYVSCFLNFSTLLHLLVDNLKSLIFHVDTPFCPGYYESSVPKKKLIVERRKVVQDIF